MNNRDDLDDLAAKSVDHAIASDQNFTKLGRLRSWTIAPDPRKRLSRLTAFLRRSMVRWA